MGDEKMVASVWKLIVTTCSRDIYENENNLMAINKRSAVAVDMSKCSNAKDKVPNFENKKETIEYIDKNNLWEAV
jgi:hypothetical protein